MMLLASITALREFVLPLPGAAGAKVAREKAVVKGECLSLRVM
jgi:hypothetical protein